MQKIYSIIDSKIDNNEIIYNIKIDFSHPLFKGHFPNKPILPGVVMCDIIRHLVSDYLDIKVNLSFAKSIKFSKLIIPSNDNNYFVKTLINTTDGGYNVKSSISKNEIVYFKLNAEYKEK